MNTVRGALVDTPALVAALRHGKLDVFEREPLQIEAVDGVLDRLILTPHMAWYTEETELAIGAKPQWRRAVSSDQAPIHAVVTPPQLR